MEPVDFLEIGELEHLVRLGFRPADRGGTYRHNGTSLTLTEDWACLTRSVGAALVAARSGRPQGAPLQELGQPGLWKSVGEGRQQRRVFDLPLGVIRRAAEAYVVGGEEEETEGTALGSAVAWALATADGRGPTHLFVNSANNLPSRDELQSWVPSEALTVEAGPYARQGFLLDEPGRLALRFPIVPDVPPDLPKPRRKWLRALLLDAQSRWRLVRFGLERGHSAFPAAGKAGCPPVSESVQAEVDLTGAPAPLLEGLVGAALDALRSAVAWVVAPCVLVANAACPSRALAEIGPVGAGRN